MDTLEHIFATIHASMIMPAQFVVTMVALIPKPDESWRPIGLMCMLFRWFMSGQRWRLAQWDEMVSNS